jgi:predicted flap endonuclease-1-like 5' DNA nuclease
MTHYLIELAIWLLATFLLGCLIGTVLRRLLGKREAVQAAAAEDLSPVMAGEPAVHAGPAPGLAPMAPRWNMQADDDAREAPPQAEAGINPAVVPLAADQAAAAPRMPVGISGPRDGRPDNLQRISGVGPRNEQILHSLGFYHFDQIAQWTEQHVEWVDGYLRFNGRIARENWVEQCRLLAAGEEEEFFRLYGSGGVRDAEGHSFAGERTRQS